MTVGRAPSAPLGRRRGINRRSWESPQGKDVSRTVWYTFESPYGPISLGFREGVLVAVAFGCKDSQTGKADAYMRKTIRAFERYLSGEKEDFRGVAVDLSSGSAFEKEVWQALKRIPYGETRTYAAIAQKIGRPKAVRAVGSAIGKNPIPIALPCHRVLRSDGSIGGYSGGVDLKKSLLELEKRKLCSPYNSKLCTAST